MVKSSGHVCGTKSAHNVGGGVAYVLRANHVPKTERVATPSTPPSPITAQYECLKREAEAVCRSVLSSSSGSKNVDPGASTGTIAAADGALDAARRAPTVEGGVEATSLGSKSSTLTDLRRPRPPPCICDELAGCTQSIVESIFTDRRPLIGLSTERVGASGSAIVVEAVERNYEWSIPF